VTSKDTAPKRAVIYARISKDRTGAGVGVGKQEDDCRELAARLGLDVVAVRTDNDLTAFKGASRSKTRPGYNNLLDDVRSRRADAVLAWHTDRLHRDNTELEGYIGACGEGRDGIPTYTVRGGDLDLSTSNGRMIARILGAIAQGEVEHMIERQKSAKERNRKAGAWHGGPRPFGFTPDGPSIKQGGDGGLRQVPTEAEAIREAYATVLALDPKQGIGAIAREWNDAGLRTPLNGSRGGGNVWDNKAVRKVLLRAGNAGLIEHDGEFTEGKWEPIVSQDTWRAVRDVLADPARRSGPGPSPRWLLVSVLICGTCDGRRFRVTAAGKRSANAPSYTCVSLQHAPEVARAAGLKRFHLSREVERLDAYVEDIIIERLSRLDVVAALNTRPEADIPALDRRRTEINAELEEWARAPGITPRQLQIKNAPLLAELASVERQISEALRADPLPEFTGNDPAEVWAALKAAGNTDRMRAVARLLLRVRLLPVGRAGNPPGCRPGTRKPFSYDAVQILPPDA
jgi:DNA invertase Pin-like site-specific DNA recombinase